MDFQSHAHPAQPALFTCTGCGTWAGGPGTMTVRSRKFTGYVCPYCSDRASRDARFRKQLEYAVAAGVSLREIQRICASIGVFDVPTTPGESDEAVGLPHGSTEAALWGVRL